MKFIAALAIPVLAGGLTACGSVSDDVAVDTVTVTNCGAEVTYGQPLESGCSSTTAG